MNIVTCRGCEHLPYGMSGYCIHSPEDNTVTKILDDLSHAIPIEKTRILVPLSDISWCSHVPELKRRIV